MSDNRFFSFLGIILAVFLGIRIAFLNSLFDTVLVDILVLDSDWYYRWAASLARGFGHPDGPFWIGPGLSARARGTLQGNGKHRDQIDSRRSDAALSVNGLLSRDDREKILG